MHRKAGKRQEKNEKQRKQTENKYLYGTVSPNV